MKKQWTEERRQAQAERCRKKRPWEHSTGPKTEEGKARSSLNAFRHGDRRSLKTGRELVDCHKRFLKLTQKFIECMVSADELKNARLIELLQKRESKRTDKTSMKSMGLAAHPSDLTQTK